MNSRGDIPIGKCVGEDEMRNKYYENNELLFGMLVLFVRADLTAHAGRHRFVEYYRKDFDGSQIPAEWYV